MASFLRELELLLSTPHAFIHLQTHDESAALGAVSRCASLVGRKILDWTCTRGLADTDGTVTTVDEVLSHIESDREPTIYVLKDFHPYMSDPIVVRRLRELEPRAAAFGLTIVFMGPVALDAPELQADLSVVQVPPPDRERVRAIVDVVFPPATFVALERDSLVNAVLGLGSRQVLRALHKVKRRWAASPDKVGFEPARAAVAEK